MTVHAQGSNNVSCYYDLCIYTACAFSRCHLGELQLAPNTACLVTIYTVALLNSVLPSFTGTALRPGQQVVGSAGTLRIEPLFP